MDSGRDEVVAEGVHGDERRELARVPEVVGEGPARERRAGGRLAGEDVDLLAADLLPDEGKCEAGEVRAAADAPDHDIGERARELHLGQRLLADDRLVQEDVVEHAPERVGRVLSPRSVLDRFGDGDAQAPGGVGVSLENRAACLGLLRRARDDARAPGLHHRAPVRLLVVRDLDHVDLALEAQEPAGERQGASPLPRPGLGGQPLAAFLLRVVRLRDGRVRLVAPRR